MVKKNRARRAGTSRPRRRGPVVACRCEEVTEDEVRKAIRAGYHSLEELKRVLRTGMGHCQGRGCLRIIARLVAEETGKPASDQRYPSSRPPLKPLPLRLLGSYRDDEDR